MQYVRRLPRHLVDDQESFVKSLSSKGNIRESFVLVAEPAIERDVLYLRVFGVCNPQEFLLKGFESSRELDRKLAKSSVFLLGGKESTRNTCFRSATKTLRHKSV